MHTNTSSEPVEPKTPAPDTDYFLQDLVELFGNSGLEVGVGMTLQVSGMLVSGRLVGGKKYFESAAEDMISSFPDADVQSTLRTYMHSYSTLYTGLEERRKKDEPVPKPVFIHLRDARFFSPSGGPLPSNQGVWWRGRISEVQGFVFGITEKNT